MYREAEASLAAENARLRDEVRRLAADADVTRRMTAPKRVLRLLGIAGVAFVAAIDVAAVYAVDWYRHELAAIELDDQVVGEELVQTSRALDQALLARDLARGDLAPLQARLAKLQALEEAWSVNRQPPEVPWIVEDRPASHGAGLRHPRSCARGVCP